ncbi:MAG: hypothetical protein ACOC2H_06110 [Spirochaetota bacterium]
MRRVLFIILLAAAPLSAQDTQQNQNGDDAAVTAPGQVEWGAGFDTVKESVKGRLQYFEKNREIVSSEGEITYTYGFFYPDPEIVGTPMDDDDTAENQDQAADGTEADGAQGDAADASEAEFSYVIVHFPYLAMDDIKQKYVEKYGDPSSQLIEDNRGVIIWESEQTMITMWIDEYEGKPYCRKINYLSKEFTDKLESYRTRIFNQKEIDALNRIEP